MCKALCAGLCFTGCAAGCAVDLGLPFGDIAGATVVNASATTATYNSCHF